MTSTNNNNKNKIKNVLFMNGKEIKKNADIKSELEQLARANDPRFVSVVDETVANKTGNGSSIQRHFKLTNNPSAHPISRVLAEHFPTSGTQTITTGINVGEAWTPANFAAITKEFIIMASVPGRDLTKAFDNETSSKVQYSSQLFNAFVELTYPDKDDQAELANRKQVLRTLRDGGAAVERLLDAYAKKKKVSRENMPSVAEIKAVAHRTYLVQGRDGKYTHSTFNRDGSKKSTEPVADSQPVSGARVVDRKNPTSEFVSTKAMYTARLGASTSKAVTARNIVGDTKDFYYVTRQSMPLVLHLPFEVAVRKAHEAAVNEKKLQERKDFMEANGFFVGDKKVGGGRGGKTEETAKYDAMRRAFALKLIEKHSHVTYNVLVNTNASLTAIANAYNDVRKGLKNDAPPLFSDLTEKDMA